MDVIERCLRLLLDLQTSDVTEDHLAAYIVLLVENHLRGLSEGRLIATKLALVAGYRERMSGTERSRHILHLLRRS